MKRFVGVLGLVSVSLIVNLPSCSSFSDAMPATSADDAGSPSDGSSSDGMSEESDASAPRLLTHEDARTAFVTTDASFIYWWSAQHQAVRKVAKVAYQDVIVVSARPTAAVTELKATESGLFWLEVAPEGPDGGAMGGRIMRLRGDGTVPGPITVAPGQLGHLAIGAEWALATTGGGVIGSFFDGSAISSGFGIDGQGFASDGQIAYYTYLGGIFRYAPNGSTSNVIQGLEEPTELVAEGSTLFGLTQTTTGNAVFRIDDGKSEQTSLEAQQLSDVVGGPVHLALDSSGVVIVNAADGTIRRVARSGGDQGLVLGGLDSPNSVAADVDGIYWTTDSGDVGWLPRQD